ncbi:MAG: signal peptidase II [Phycisphaerales bacterium]
MSEKNCVNPCLFTKQVSTLSAHLIFWPLVIIGIAADLISKSMMFNWLSSRPSKTFSIIDGLFQLVMVENRGAAWGIASDKTVTLVTVSTIAMIIVLGVFLFSGKHQLTVVIALGLFAAGIVGNLYDRVFNHGRVRDFLDFYHGNWHFPAFNVADSMLSIAVALLILTTLFSPNQENPNDKSSVKSA